MLRRRGWQGWIQLENFSAWNGLPFASKNNGFDGTDAVLEFNKPEQVKHIAMLEEMNKEGRFSATSVVRMNPPRSSITVMRDDHRLFRFSRSIREYAEI